MELGKRQLVLSRREVLEAEKEEVRVKKKKTTENRDSLSKGKARIRGGVAQLGEHLPCKQGVKSSNLSISICTKACV